MKPSRLTSLAIAAVLVIITIVFGPELIVALEMSTP